MSATTWNWLLASVGTVASVAGVVFSVLAWVQAKGAKAAAEEARNIVKTRDTAHELVELAGDAKELLAAVRDGQSQKAVKAATDLVHDLSILKGRRSNYLPPESLKEIDEVVGALNLVRNTLEKVEFPAGQRLSAIRNCQRIHQRVCEIAGSVEYQAEEPQV